MIQPEDKLVEPEKEEEIPEFTSQMIHSVLCKMLYDIQVEQFHQGCTKKGITVKRSYLLKAPENMKIEVVYDKKSDTFNIFVPAKFKRIRKIITPKLYRGN